MSAQPKYMPTSTVGAEVYTRMVREISRQVTLNDLRAVAVAKVLSLGPVLIGVEITPRVTYFANSRD